MTSRSYKTKLSNAADQHVTSASPSARRLRRTLNRDQLGEMSDMGLVVTPRGTDEPVESEQYLERKVSKCVMY